MSKKRKATSGKSQSTTVTPAWKNNWIFTGILDSKSVEKLCLTIFDSHTNLNSEVFKYAIVGTNQKLDIKKGVDSYNIYGYVQIKKHRWTRKELLQHFGVTVTTYSSTELVFGNPEGKWKPNSIVEYIKMFSSHYTEGGELRKRGSKPNVKKEDEDYENSDDEEDEEVVVEPAARRAVGARPNPFIANCIPSEAPAAASSPLMQRLNIKPAASILSTHSVHSRYAFGARPNPFIASYIPSEAPAASSSSLTQCLNIKPAASIVSGSRVHFNLNRFAIGKQTVEPTTLPHTNAAFSTHAVPSADSGSRKEFQFQSPFPGLKSDLCKHLEKFLLSKMDSRFNAHFSKMDSRFNAHFAELDKRGEEHIELIRAEVYQAITDSFGSIVASENPEEQEDPDTTNPREDEIGDEAEVKGEGSN